MPFVAGESAHKALLWWIVSPGSTRFEDEKRKSHPICSKRKQLVHAIFKLTATILRKCFPNQIRICN
jgi:hypothetical protein